MKQKHIIWVIALIGIILISGCAQNKVEIIGGGTLPSEPPLYVCGSAEVLAVVITPFHTIHGGAFMTINLSDIYSYKTGNSTKQLADKGDLIDLAINGEEDYSGYSKCPQPECPPQVEGQPALPCKVVLCNLTDEQKFGSWNSYKLKEGNVIKLSIQGKAAGEGSCDPDRFPNFRERLYWVTEDSEIVIVGGI